MSDLNEEALQSLPFSSYLAYMKDYAREQIHFQPRSHGAFIIAREIMRHIINRYIQETNSSLEDYCQHDSIGKNLFMDEKILDKYITCKKDTEKREVMLEFKKELDYDLSNMIRNYERFSPRNINASFNWFRRSNYIPIPLV